MSRPRINATYNIEPVYSYTEEDWVKCPKCKKKLFKAVDRKGSVVEIKCRSCGVIENIEI